MADRQRNPLFAILKSARHRFDAKEIVEQFRLVSEERVDALAESLGQYISANLPAAFEKRNELGDYRTNPYVLMTAASVRDMSDPTTFGSFLLNSKLYMALETSFGKSVESSFVGQYPIHGDSKWADAPEKIAEFKVLEGLSREGKARARTASVWREIDKSCVVGNRRFMTTIKSGPNTINDTQVQGMTQAIISHHDQWLCESKATYPEVNELDVVIGLTYGTEKSTNNKDNQILIKLLDHGFEEEDRQNCPGVLIDSGTRSIRVYRRIGRSFWAFIGQPDDPATSWHVYLEILLGLAKALSVGVEQSNLEDRINAKIQALAGALSNLQFPRDSLPEWIREDFSDDELFWFATAMSAFFDEGI